MGPRLRDLAIDNAWTAGSLGVLRPTFQVCKTQFRRTKVGLGRPFKKGSAGTDLPAAVGLRDPVDGAEDDDEDGGDEGEAHQVHAVHHQQGVSPAQRL